MEPFLLSKDCRTLSSFKRQCGTLSSFRRHCRTLSSFKRHCGTLYSFKRHRRTLFFFLLFFSTDTVKPFLLSKDTVGTLSSFKSNLKPYLSHTTIFRNSKRAGNYINKPCGIVLTLSLPCLPGRHSGNDN